jgi:hypothetical protein
MIDWLTGLLKDHPALVLLLVIAIVAARIWVEAFLSSDRGPAARMKAEEAALDEPGPTVPPLAPDGSLAPAGWYPRRDGTRRWWDGQSWTEDTDS